MSDGHLTELRSIEGAKVPRPEHAFPSPPDDWQNEVIYFLLPDRFSDGNEDRRNLLKSNRKATARGQAGNWHKWATSGSTRWQGGTLSGIISKLPYLSRLGITALWIGPVFRQRMELNTYHGYATQNFLDVDPRFGTKQDLIDLIAAAHGQNIRVILDIVFNHSANNWVYQNGENLPPYQPYPRQLNFGGWRDSSGQAGLASPVLSTDGVWPIEFQLPEAYMRAGLGSLDNPEDENPEDGTLEFRRSDFPPDGLRKFNHYAGPTLTNLALCYKYWIGLTDCDGFRIDTGKHIAVDVWRSFTGAIKEFAASIGKSDFFLVAEIGGGDVVQRAYLDRIDRHKLNAALDIGSAKQVLRDVARGKAGAYNYFQRFANLDDIGESRKLGSRLVSLLDDHDNISCEKIRFSNLSSNDHQVIVALAIQLFSLSIPCIYYGSEQGLSFNGSPGDPGYEVQYLAAEGWAVRDWALREAIFGPEHPLLDAAAGTTIDLDSPGFGPYGTSGFHCFDEKNAVFARAAHLLAIRKEFVPLRVGRLYQRPLGQFGWNHTEYPGGEIIAWSRILDDQEVLVVANSNESVPRDADVLVDFNLNAIGSSLTVVGNTAERAAAASESAYAGAHPIGSRLEVRRAPEGPAFVSITKLEPAEVLILARPSR